MALIDREKALMVDFNLKDPHMIKTEIENIPVVDAVPVVRCKDCKYYKYESVFVEMLCRGHFKCCEVYPDDFCSYGERKEQDNGTD